MQAWLRSRDIEFSPLMTKVELYEIIKRNRPPIRYQIDEIAEENGHFVLRTPVRHCELNPIELIWTQIKQYVAYHNNTFNLKDVKKLVNEAFDTITASNWSKCVKHTMEIENKMWLFEGFQDIDPVIINLNTSDDHTDAYACSSDDNADDEETEAYELSSDNETEAFKRSSYGDYTE